MTQNYLLIHQAEFITRHIQRYFIIKISKFKLRFGLVNSINAYLELEICVYRSAFLSLNLEGGITELFRPGFSKT